MSFDPIAAARRRTRRALLFASVVVVGLVGLVYPAGLYVDAHLGSPPPGPTATWPTPLASSTVWRGAGTAADPTESTNSWWPTGVSWVRVAGVDLPVSAATGPTNTARELASGFAHTRAGAVVAALHLLVRTTPQVGPDVYAPTLAAQVVGADAAAMRTAVDQEYRQLAAAAGIEFGQPLGDLPATVAGARVDTFTAAPGAGTAAIAVCTTTVDATGATRYAATRIRLQWTDGDWRLVAPPGGVWDTQVHLIDPATAAGFTPLPGR